jgi:hypothetical protein
MFVAQRQIINATAHTTITINFKFSTPSIVKFERVVWGRVLNNVFKLYERKHLFLSSLRVGRLIVLTVGTFPEL